MRNGILVMRILIVVLLMAFLAFAGMFFLRRLVLALL